MPIATIRTGAHSSAQGPRLARHADGRITILAGRRRLTGWPVALPARATAPSPGTVR